MKGEDLVVGHEYRVVKNILRIYTCGKYYYLKTGTIVRCLRGVEKYQGSSRHVVVSVPRDDHTSRSQLGVGKEFTLANHTSLVPLTQVNDSETSREKRAARVRATLEARRSEYEKLESQVANLASEIADLEEKLEKLEEFKTDEAEIAAMLHTLITKRDVLTPEDIEKILLSRNATNSI